MQISTKFTIAIHVLTAVRYFSQDYKITSDFLAGSIGSNPVIIRNIMSQLREAGLIVVKRGPGGITIDRPLAEITFLDVYKAVETNSDGNLFRFHENPNPACPVGRNIHQALDKSLREIQQHFEEDLRHYTLADVYDEMVEAVRNE
ncbi:Rrf2 family transcriptional regulator [Mitsuokella sp.]|uniref:Rrf2 family transcriptional regulator n=1 Tax=Mitsuokella TaxID=52225 RepID=UPI0029E22356|nr:Rrf2 family transcriptional regulator [Mitsuokella sp.]MDD6382346.1 Rrf2 family transcriptional regulator [Selenomonadaceae bacterium]MDY4475729.1 Rrf2 family transcriptional regulator [Mitsuokella sp.]